MALAATVELPASAQPLPDRLADAAPLLVTTATMLAFSQAKDMPAWIRGIGIAAAAFAGYAAIYKTFKG